jgi:hypothetical protein
MPPKGQKGKVLDMKGWRFGKLTVLKQSGTSKDGALWLCICDCGNSTVRLGARLRAQGGMDCGCGNAARVAMSVAVTKTHGLSSHPIFHRWCQMLRRCNDPACDAYRYYGGRGIKVCDEWNSPAVFIKWAESNGFSKELTLERINNNGNYEPGNCRWATREEQQHNKRDSIIIEAKGFCGVPAQWEDLTGINYKTIQNRIRRGWNRVDAVTIPLLKRGSRYKLLESRANL